MSGRITRNHADSYAPRRWAARLALGVAFPQAGASRFAISALLTIASLAAGSVCPLLAADVRSASSATAAASNPLQLQLIRDGVPVSATETIRLPAPTGAAGLGVAEQRARIKSIPDSHVDWDSFTRHSVVAPFVLKIGAPAESAAGGASTGRQVDLWFVVYGDFDSLADDDFVERQFQSAAGEDDSDNRPRTKLFSDAELASRGLTLPGGPNQPKFLAGDFTLLDKTRVSGVVRTLKTRESDELVVASVLDDRFDHDAEFPNAWRPITRDSAGKRQIGARQPYAGFGSYGQVTRLAEPAGALLVEYHVAFNEPKGWFNGANLLRSKLPIVAQEGVRKLRRSLDGKKS